PSGTQEPAQPTQQPPEQGQEPQPTIIPGGDNDPNAGWDPGWQNPGNNTPGDNSQGNNDNSSNHNNSSNNNNSSSQASAGSGKAQNVARVPHARPVASSSSKPSATPAASGSPSPEPESDSAEPVAVPDSSVEGDESGLDEDMLISALASSDETGSEETGVTDPKQKADWLMIAVVIAIVVFIAVAAISVIVLNGKKHPRRHEDW
ncbi:MAG TPA: hypothetical protein DCZ91_04940, partial [Lachnospiraceae bacterium]|nr:hypothetical protein [Lachnospiraceae bacterium]